MPVMTEATQPLPELSPIEGKLIIARFDGGALSSDGGPPALREIEERIRGAEFQPRNSGRHILTAAKGACLSGIPAPTPGLPFAPPRRAARFPRPLFQIFAATPLQTSASQPHIARPEAGSDAPSGLQNLARNSGGHILIGTSRGHFSSTPHPYPFAAGSHPLPSAANSSRRPNSQPPAATAAPSRRERPRHRHHHAQPHHRHAMPRPPRLDAHPGRAPPTADRPSLTRALRGDSLTSHCGSAAPCRAGRRHWLANPPLVMPGTAPGAPIAQARLTQCRPIQRDNGGRDGGEKSTTIPFSPDFKVIAGETGGGSAPGFERSPCLTSEGPRDEDRPRRAEHTIGAA